MPIQVPVEQRGLEASIERAAKKAGKSLSINLGKSGKSIDSLSQPLGRITGKADEFTKSMEAANARVLAFGASVGVLNAVTRGFKELVTTTIQVEKQMASINTILKADASGLSKFKKEIFDVARNTEQSFDTVATAALELSRQGLSAEQVLKRLNDSMILSRLSGLGAAEAVSGLTAAVNSFASSGIKSSEVLNKLSAAAASAAVSEKDLIEGIKRSASVANQAGVTFDELVGVITAVQQKTARGGAVIGNSFKTIFTRLQSFKNLETLQDLGVQVTDISGKVLPATKLIENLSSVVAKMPKQAGQDLATNLVGRFQVAPFLAILDDYNSKTQVAIDITKVAENATTQAYQRNEALNKTLSAAINETVVNLKELANTLGEIGVTDNLKNIIGFFSDVIGKLESLFDEETGSSLAKNLLKGIANVITGPGLIIFTAVIAKLTADLVKFGVGSIQTFFGLNQAAKTQANLQTQIASTLLDNKRIADLILGVENSTLSVEVKRAQQTEIFTTALNAQLGVYQQMNAIATRLAPGVGKAIKQSGRGAFGRGVASGYTPSFAGGYSAEVSAISRGVGGAPSNAKAVNIPNFNFGGGMVGPVVANNSEFIVPNFGGGGGSAIFNQNMAETMGLPPNARPINASAGLFTGRGAKKGVIHDDRFAMVVPKQIAPRKVTGKVGNQTYGFNVFGYSDRQLKAKEASTLKDRVSKFGVGLASEEARVLTQGSPTAGKVGKLSNSGSVGSLAGTIFETAISALTKQSPEFDSKQTQTFDFFGQEIAGLRKLFPQMPPSVAFSEAKIGTNTRLNNSMATKMKKFGAGTKAGVLGKKATKEFMGSTKSPGLFKGGGGKAGLQKSLGQKFMSTAGGYIPNFANGRPPPWNKNMKMAEVQAAGFTWDKKGVDAFNKSLAQSGKGLEKVGKKSMLSGNRMMGLLFASSMLTGATQDTTSAMGVLSNSTGKAVQTMVTMGMLGSALGSMSGKMGMFGKVLGKLGPVAIGIGIFKGGLDLVTDAVHFFSGETDQAKLNIGLMAAAAQNAAVRLDELDPVAQAHVKGRAEELINILGGDGAIGTRFENEDNQPTVLKAIQTAISSGVKESLIGGALQAAEDKALGKDLLLRSPQLTGEDVQKLLKALNDLSGSEAMKAGEKMMKAALANTEKGMKLRHQLLDPNVEQRLNFGRDFKRTLTEVTGKGFGDELESLERALLGKGISRDRVADLLLEALKITRQEGEKFADEDAALGDQIRGRDVTQILQKGLLEVKTRGAEFTPAATDLARSKAFGSVGAFDLNEVKQMRNIEKAQQSALESVVGKMAGINEIARAITGDSARADAGREFLGGLTFDKLSNKSDIQKELMELREIVFGPAGKFMLTDAQIEAEALRLEGLVDTKQKEAEILNIIQQQTFEIETQGNIREQAGAEAASLEKKMLSGELDYGAVRPASMFARARGGFKRDQAGARMAAFEKSKGGDFSAIHALDLADELNGKLISASEAFATNIGDALVDAISKGQSLGDTLRQVAADFLNTMSKALMNNAINNALNKGGGFLGGLFGFNTGGQVRGGSGARDDVPALLTGGEFVMNKKAVQNYGSGFMGALNSGAVPRYAKGGMFTPGTYGQGAISGSSNLLNFATQSYTGGLQDMFLSGRGLAGLSLEPQSGRLTMSGRKNSPAFQREQESKRKAFELFSQQYSKNQQEKQKKEESKGSLLGALLGFGVSALASGVMGGGLSSLFTKGKATGGAVPYSAGIDSVPTMLSGGEFVMNAGATQTLGAGNLAALNAGGGIGGGGGDAIVGKLDELNQTIASSNTEINITVNSDGTENTNSANAPDQQRGLAVKIKDVVRQVIEDEKRLGGSLRMA